jgi:hypothetical protein
VKASGAQWSVQYNRIEHIDAHLYEVLIVGFTPLRAID